MQNMRTRFQYAEYALPTLLMKLFFHHMQTHASQQFRNVLQNPVEPRPIFTCLLRAAHSWFNQVKSPFGVKKSLLILSPV